MQPAASALALIAMIAASAHAHAATSRPTQAAIVIGERPDDGQERLAVPTAQALIEATEAVRAKYADAFELDSNRLSEKCAVSQRLSGLATDIEAPPDEKYALLYEAYTWAIEGQDLELAMAAVDALAQGWRVDELELRCEIVLKLLPHLRISALDGVLSAGFDVINDLLASDRADQAELLLAELQPRASKVKDRATKKRYTGLVDALAMLGRGPKSPLGVRREGRAKLARKESGALDLALDWLVAHQSDDGSWGASSFTKQCPPDSAPCTSPGNGALDVGVSGLALLALLGEGSSLNTGKYQVPIQRGVSWLALQADPKSGLIGKRSSSKFLYCHAIATQVLCEVLPMRPQLEPLAAKAMRFINRSRNPYGAWRYSQPPTGKNDTSVTSWMLMAIRAALNARLEVDPDAYEGALAWLDEVTDLDSGLVGYDRFPAAAWHYGKTQDPAATPVGDATTAMGLLSRILIGQDSLKKDPILKKHAELLLHRLPAWGPDEPDVDMCYWYFGTEAMFQLGGKYWRSWLRALVPAILKSQRTTGDATGSWDPIGPSGQVGGRIYSTALMALGLEAPFRRPRLVTK